MNNATLILKTDLITIMKENEQLNVYIKLSEGGMIEHNPFPATQEGLVAALLLAADVNAGKFYPRRIVLSMNGGTPPEMRHLSDGRNKS